MNGKILIVDDDAHIRALIEITLEILEDDDVELFTADNGGKALEIIHQEHPNLVFLDAMMPELDGFAVCSRVKQVEKFQDLVVVMLTAKGQAFDRHQAAAVGVDRYLTKPFDPDQLLAVAREVLGLSRRSRE